MTEEEEQKERERKALLNQLEWVGLSHGQADEETSNLSEPARRYFNDVFWGRPPDPDDRTRYKEEIAKSVTDVCSFWLPQVRRNFMEKEFKKREFEWIFPAKYIISLVKGLATWMPEDYTIALIGEIGDGLDEHYAIEGKSIKANISTNLVYKDNQAFVYDYNDLHEYKEWKKATKRKGCAFVLPLDQKKNLIAGQVNQQLKDVFEKNEYPLLRKAFVIERGKGNWIVRDGTNLFTLKERNGELYVFKGKRMGAPSSHKI